MRPNWVELNRKAVEEVRRQSARQLANPDQGPDQGLARLAKKLGITRQAVSLWDARIPSERVRAINRILGIPKHKLRIDKFDKFGPRKPNGRS